MGAVKITIYFHQRSDAATRGGNAIRSSEFDTSF